MTQIASLQFHTFEAAELQENAKSMIGTAAGMDGFTGSELAALLYPVWVAFASLLNRWVQRTQVPEIWTHIRQIHLPKENLTQHEPVKPEKLRPISILSAWWRLTTSTIAKRSSARTWVNQLCPPASHGGLCQREAFDGILSLDQHWRNSRGIIVSQDYEKCFDSVSPTLALGILREAGMPPEWVNFLQLVWTQRSPMAKPFLRTRSQLVGHFCKGMLSVHLR